MLHYERITPQILSAMCGMCNVGLLLLSKERGIAFWNQWLEEASGLDSRDVLGKSLNEVFPDIDDSRLTQAINEIFSHNLSAVLSPRLHPSVFPLNVRTSINGNAKEKMEQLISLNPLLTETGKIFCLVQVTDVTAAIARENTLREQSRSLSEKAVELEHALESEKSYTALQAKFTSFVSHEFRTPLAIIDGTAQRIIRLKNSITPESLLERTTNIRSAVERMVDLIETMLYTSRLDAGKIEMNIQPCNLGQMVADACDRQSEISPEYDICTDLNDIPEHIDADFQLVEHIVTNMLSNAVKFSPDSPLIEVTATVDGGHALLAVKDHGLGIPADDLPQMFERYFRAKTSEGISGTGLGLAVCKEFVEMLGGTIEVASIEGEGSTFTIRLPINCNDQ